jgi:hypothetical protein
MAKLNLTYMDYDSELATVGVYGINLTAANFTAQEGLWGDVEAAIDAVSLGTRTKTLVSAVETVTGGVKPNDVNAQRERKWLVRGTTSTGFPVSIEIPCADAILLQAGGGKMDEAGAEWIALKAALDAYGRSNRLTETVTWTDAVMVGRTL